MENNDRCSCVFLVIFHICAPPQLYVKHRINPQNNNQITSIQVCVMGFFLHEVGPPLEKFSGSAPGDH